MKGSKTKKKKEVEVKIINWRAVLAVTLTVHRMQRAYNGGRVTQLLSQFSRISKQVARLTIVCVSLNYFHEHCQHCCDVAFARVSNKITATAAAAETPQATVWPPCGVQWRIKEVK